MTSSFIIIVPYTDIVCKDNLLSALTIEASVQLALRGRRRKNFPLESGTGLWVVQDQGHLLSILLGERRRGG